MYKKAIGVLLTVICLFYLFLLFNKEHVRIAKYLNNANNILVCIAIVIFTGVTVNFIAYVYVKIVRCISKQEFSLELMYKNYLYSNLGKYLPGNFMHYAGRNILGSRLGISHADIALSSVFEVLVSLAGAFLIIITFSKSSIFYILSKVQHNFWIYAIVLSTLLICSLIIYKKRGNFIKNYLTIFKRKEIFWLAFQSTISYYLIFLVGAFTLVWVVSFVSIKDLNNSIIGIIVSSYVVSWFIGFITPGSPGGIGIRETVLLFFLSNFMQTDVIIASLILHRILNISGDFFAVILGNLLFFIRNGRDAIN